jgi:hypothetical protein
VQSVPGAILIGGNIYHPSAAPAYVLSDDAPQPLQEIVFQVSTKGTELNYANTALIYIDILGAEVLVPYTTYTQLAISSGMGVNVESMFTWDLSSISDPITSYQLRFEGVVANLSLDAVILDTLYSPSPVTSFCFGDGAGTICPCGNLGSQGRGCSNGSSQAGAILDWSGSAVVANGDLILSASDLPANVFGLFFQGSNQVNQGMGSAFGDGLLCVNSPIIRLEVASTDALGNIQSTVGVATSGGALAGSIRNYQLWYRDTQGSPCGSNFNTTNALQVNWN